jgi:hypothetical protein
MIKKLLFGFFILFVFLNVFSQKTVYKLPVGSETNISNLTFFYTLPKTAFRVDAVITKTSNLKGLYADFVEKMLGITNYCKENTISYQLKSINITPFSVPDKNLQFVVELSSIQMKNSFLQSLYGNNAATIFHTFSTIEQSNVDILSDFFKNHADVILQQTHETYTETRIIDGVVSQVPVTQTKITMKTLMQQAQEAVDFIEKIRKDRYDILSFSQEVTLSKGAFEYIVNQLNELEKKYLELFVGITVLEDIHETFVIYPDPESALLPVCTVAPSEGFSTSMSKNTAHNYYLSCTPQISTNLQEEFVSHKAKKNLGYQIRKAVPVFVSLVNGNKKELLGVFSIYQFGLLETLPANLDSFEIEKWGYIY